MALEILKKLHCHWNDAHRFFSFRGGGCCCGGGLSDFYMLLLWSHLFPIPQISVVAFQQLKILLAVFSILLLHLFFLLCSVFLFPVSFSSIVDFFIYYVFLMLISRLHLIILVCFLSSFMQLNCAFQHGLFHLNFTMFHAVWRTETYLQLQQRLKVAVGILDPKSQRVGGFELLYEKTCCIECRHRW